MEEGQIDTSGRKKKKKEKAPMLGKGGVAGEMMKLKDELEMIKK